jgi:hypothetical protein
LFSVTEIFVLLSPEPVADAHSLLSLRCGAYQPGHPGPLFRQIETECTSHSLSLATAITSLLVPITFYELDNIPLRVAKENEPTTGDVLIELPPATDREDADDPLNGAGELLVNYELNQENGLLAQMQNAIQKKDLLHSMGAKAYEDAKKLSWYQTAEQTMAVYEKSMLDN